MTEQETVPTEEQMVEVSLSDRLQQSAFAPETIAGNNQETKVATTQTTTQQEATTSEKNNLVDITTWLKTEFDIEDANVLKQEREEFKKLKEAKSVSQQPQFANNESKIIYDMLVSGDKETNKKLREHLNQEEKLENFTTQEISDDIAGDIIKMGMKLKTPDLSEKEIEFNYNELYSIPKKPILKDETDEEFEEAMSLWKQQVDNVSMKKIIAAKIIRPELVQSKQELILPNINAGANVNAEPTAEELAKAKADADAFVKNAENSITDFKGFAAQVKDKDVDYSVAYDLSEEEKTSVKSQVAAFAESGFNANSLFSDRWTIKNEDGSLSVNVKQVIKDLSAIQSMENAVKKIASESASTRMEAYFKSKKNISLNTNTGNNSPVLLNNQEDISARLQEAAFGKVN